MSFDVASEAYDSFVRPAPGQPNPVVGPDSPGALQPAAARRSALARAIVHLLGAAIADPQAMVFPDGELIPVEEIVGLARAAGFEIIDVQSLRPHYALTLAAWIASLEKAWPAAVDVAGNEVARTWRLYMSAARLGFERGDLDVCQLLLAKPAENGPARLPFRPWW